MVSSSLPNQHNIRRQQELLLGSLALLISLVCAALSYSRQLDAFDWLHYDSTQQASQLSASGDVVIIEIDDKSLNEIGRWPWARSVHADLLEVLRSAKVDWTVFDILFPELDHTQPNSDAKLAQAIEVSGNVLLALYFETFGQQGVVVEGLPHPLFSEGAAGMGHIHLESDADGVVRTVYLKEGVGEAYWPHLSLATLTRALEDTPINGVSRRSLANHLPGARPSQSEGSGGIGLFRDYYNHLPMPASDQGFRFFSYSDVLNKKVDLSLLKDKIVYIGATATGLGDILTTPAGEMAGVELNAWLLEALMQNKLIQSVSPGLTSLYVFLSTFFCLFIIGRLSPKLFLIISVLMITGFSLFSSALVLFADTWLRSAANVFGILIFFPLWSWIRAENTLRYLRTELDELTSTQTPSALASDEQLGIHFLTQVGLISPSTHQTSELGLTAINTLNPFAKATASQEILQDTADNKLVLEHPALQTDDTFWVNLASNTEHSKRTEELDTSGIELVTRTISQIKSARKQDKQSRQFVESSLSGLQDAVIISSVTGLIRYTNTQFKLWFFDPVASPASLSLLDVLSHFETPASTHWVAELQSLFQDGESRSVECKLAKFDQQQFRANDHSFLLQMSLVATGNTNTNNHATDEHIKNSLICTFTDITQLKAAEMARADALSFLSHDLRSPMVSVISILEQNRDKQITVEARNNIELLVRKNLEYAESFLQLSKADAITEAQLDLCDMHAVLDTAHAHALALGSTKHMQVKVERTSEDCWVNAEFSLLERAVNNLVSNAIKYSPANTSITLTLKKDAEHVSLHVTDEGPGIPENEQKRLFERFVRSKNTQQQHGAGLGLSFVATAIQKMHGTVTIKSKINQGSTFSITLPALSESELLE